VIGRALAIGLLLLAAGCASSDPDATPTTDAPFPPVETADPSVPAVAVQTLDCRSPIATSRRPDPGSTAVLDAVAATPLGSVAFQNGRFQIHAESDVPGGYVGKTGLQIRVGREVWIRSVGSPHAAFVWGNTGVHAFGRVFRVPACPAPASAPQARWLTYPGLIATDGRGCLRIRVQEGDRHEDLTIGAGAACH